MAGKFPPARDSGKFLLWTFILSPFLSKHCWEICPGGRRRRISRFNKLHIKTFLFFLRNAKCETFRKANKRKSSKSHKFRHFWAKMAGKFAPAGDSGEFLIWNITFSAFLSQNGWEICPCGRFWWISPLKITCSSFLNKNGWEICPCGRWRRISP